MSWEGVRLSCSLTCSRMYCWQKQQGRPTVSPEHSQPHERMMVDYLQEMSRAGPPDSQDGALSAAEQSCAAADGWEGGKEEEKEEGMRGNPSYPLLSGKLFLKGLQEIRPHTCK